MGRPPVGRGAARDEVQVAVVDVADGLREEQLDAPHQAEEAEVAVVGEIAAQELREAVGGVDEVDLVGRRRADVGRLGAGVGRERNPVVGVEEHLDALELVPGVRVLVRQPDVRRASVEQAEAATHLLAVPRPRARVVVEADARRPAPRRRHDVGRAPVQRLDERVRGRGVGEDRRVEADAVGEREVVADPPLVAGVEPELVDPELGRLPGVGGAREAVAVGLGQPLLEERRARELIRRRSCRG